MDFDQRRSGLERYFVLWGEYALCRVFKLHLLARRIMGAKRVYSTTPKQGFI